MAVVTESSGALVQPPIPLHNPVKVATENSRQITRLLFISLILTPFILACSLIYNFGQLSLWMTPGAVTFTVIFNIILLVKTFQEQKQHQTPEAFSVQGSRQVRLTTLSPIICAWILTLLWTACFGCVLAITLIITGLRGSNRFLAAGYVEFVLDGIEAVIMGLVAFKCTLERRRIIGATNQLSWYQPGQYQSA